MVMNILLAQVAIGQDFTVTKSDSVAKIDGELYVIHTIQPKQTLFSIAKTYEVKLSRLAFDNPGVLDGLKLGQTLRILKSALGESVQVQPATEKLELDGEYVLYTVPAKQTLYAISKEYNTTVTAILDANPELADGLKVGSVIRIPVPKMLSAESPKKVEMVGLPDIVKKRAFKTMDEEIIRTKSNVVLMLPLYLSLNDTIGTRTEMQGEEQIYDKSELALQFYEGFLMALDSLNSLGYEVNLKVIDTENRPWKVRKLVENGALKNADLIIGPLYSKVFAEVEQYAHLNCIPLVSPTIKSVGIIQHNPYVFKIIPSEESMIMSMGQYLNRSDSTVNLIVHYGAADEEKMAWKFRQGLGNAGMDIPPFPVYNINRSGSDSLRNRLSLTKRNNLVFLSNNQVRLASLVRKISTWTEDAYIVGYAPNSWQGFKNLEVDHFDELRIHMPTAMHVDYDNLSVQELVMKFRTLYNAEPTSFAFRGYDIAMHFIQNLDGIKEMDVQYMESVEESGVQSDFGWRQLPEGGFENTKARMIDYTGLELKLAKD
jgi:LysM repeat protein/ABC-type branched-subunit amino acid transport system substrate-binding protein